MLFRSGSAGAGERSRDDKSPGLACHQRRDVWNVNRMTYVGIDLMDNVQRHNSWCVLI